jgi:hypothetical protein
MDKIQSHGYRYINQFELDQIRANGGKLPRHSTREGQYFTLDGNYKSGDAAKGALQLPRPANEYIGRIEFDLAPVKDKIRVPRAENDTRNWVEPLAKDYPDLGTPGGGTQLLIEDAEPQIIFKAFSEL